MGEGQTARSALAPESSRQLQGVPKLPMKDLRRRSPADAFPPEGSHQSRAVPKLSMEDIRRRSLADALTAIFAGPKSARGTPAGGSLSRMTQSRPPKTQTREITASPRTPRPLQSSKVSFGEAQSRQTHTFSTRQAPATPRAGSESRSPVTTPRAWAGAQSPRVRTAFTPLSARESTMPRATTAMSPRFPRPQTSSALGSTRHSQQTEATPRGVASAPGTSGQAGHSVTSMTSYRETPPQDDSKRSNAQNESVEARMKPETQRFLRMVMLRYADGVDSLLQVMESSFQET